MKSEQRRRSLGKQQWIIPMLVSVLSTASPAAWADPGLSQNPDDYDVPKYEGLRNDSVRKLRELEDLLARLNDRVNQASNRLHRESEELAVAQKAVEDNHQVIATSAKKITELQQVMNHAEAELTDIERELPTIDAQLADERQKRQAIANQLQRAHQERDAAKTQLEKKQQELKALESHSVDLVKKSADLQRQVDKIQGEIAQTRQEKKKIQDETEHLKSQKAGIPGRMDTAKRAVNHHQGEVQKKGEEFNKLDTAATDREKRAAEETDPVKKKSLEAIAATIRRQADAKQKELRVAEEKLKHAQDQVNRLEKEMAEIDSKIAAKDAKVAELTQQNEQKRKVLAEVQKRKAAADADVAEAAKLQEPVRRAIAKAKSDLETAKTTAQTLKTRVDAADQRIAQLEKRPQQLRKRQDQLVQIIVGAQADLKKQRQRQNTAKNRHPQLVAKLEDQQRRIQSAQRELNNVARDRDQAATLVANQQQEVAFYDQRLAQVRENLRYGLEVARYDGQNDGSAAGAQEGTANGVSAGRRDGKEVGNREGREKGTSDGIARAEAQGREEGRKIGLVEGEKKGTPDGKVAGEKEGTSKGRADGLIAGYEAGFREGEVAGYEEGRKSGHAMGGYDQGRKDGLVIGKNEANRDARAQGIPQGQARADDEYLNADLADITLPNKTGGLFGLSAVFAERAQPQTSGRNYPHPLLQDEYQRSFAEAFQQAAADAYDRAYADSYKDEYSRAFDRAYDEYLNADYSHERAAALASARDAAYNEAYNDSFNRAHQQAFNASYEVAYNQALPVRRAEGVKAGHQAGFDRGEYDAYQEDYADGQAVGRREAYDQTFPAALQAAEKEGYDARVKFYSTNAVLEYDGALVVDANDDSVFAPGEQVTLTVAMKNFGKVPQKDDLVLEVTDATQGIVLEKNRDVLTGIPGQTRALVTGIGALRVAKDAQPGSTESVRIELSRKGKVLGQVALSLTVGLPYSLPMVEVDDHVLPEQLNRVKIQVRNISTKESTEEVTVRLISTDSLAMVDRPSSNLGRISAGMTAETELAFSFQEDSAFKTLSFEVQVLEGDWLLGRHRFSVESTKRWTFNPSSNGLAIVDSNSRAKMVEKAQAQAGMAFDIWDIRIEGQLTEEVAKQYLSKSLILPALSGAMDDATARMIQDVLEQGGKVFAASMDQNSSVGSMLETLARLVNQTEFAGLQVARKNFFEQNVPDFLIVRDGAGSNDVNRLAQSLTVFDLLKADIQKKASMVLTETAAGNSKMADLARSAILHELTQEMLDDKKIDGDNFKKNKASLRLTRFVNFALSKSGNERKALSILYPELNAAKKKLGWFLNGRRHAVAKILKPLKKAYKKDHK